MIIYEQLRFFVWGRPKSLCPCISAAAIVQAQREKEEEEETTQKPPPPPTLSLFFLPPETHKFDLSPTWKRQQRGRKKLSRKEKKGGKLFFFFHGLCGGKGGGAFSQRDKMGNLRICMCLRGTWNYLRQKEETTSSDIEIKFFSKFNCTLAFSTPFGTKEAKKSIFLFKTKSNSREREVENGELVVLEYERPQPRVERVGEGVEVGLHARHKLEKKETELAIWRTNVLEAQW